MSKDKPLYRKLLQKPYPEMQMLDRESINWLTYNCRPEEVPIKEVIADYKPILLTPYKHYLKHHASQRFNTIHGIRHQLRTMLYVWILSQYLNINDDENIKPLLIATFFHDIMRQDDNKDELHGINSANWIGRHFVELPESVLDAVKCHNEEGTGEQKDILCSILKAADALDRYRLPKANWWPDQNRMPIKCPDKIINFCKYLTIETERITCGVDNINEIFEIIESWLKRKHIA